MGRKRRIASALALMVVFTTTSFAYGDDFGLGNGDTGYKADNGWHDYCTYLSYPSTWSQPIADAMGYLDSATVMTTYSQSACNPWVDAQFHVSNNAEMGSGFRGFTACLSSQTNDTNHICGGAVIFLNADILTSYGQRRKTICHEAGHSVGLMHGNVATDCMVSGSSTLDFYDSHHLSHINNAY
ncbi:MAG: hypothetical protein RL508_723 [Actinomycetota bacterium]|jgi:hypothetical protein